MTTPEEESLQDKRFTAGCLLYVLSALYTRRALSPNWLDKKSLERLDDMGLICRAKKRISVNDWELTPEGNKLIEELVATMENVS